MVRPALVAKESGPQIGPAFAVERKQDTTPVPLGVSKAGGLPDLPDSLPWPKWKGHSQAFVGQLNLEELPDMPGRELLPARDTCTFFMRFSAIRRRFSSLAGRERKALRPCCLALRRWRN